MLATRYGYGVIDAVVNVYTPESYELGAVGTDDNFRVKRCCR